MKYGRLKTCRNSGKLRPISASPSVANMYIKGMNVSPEVVTDVADKTVIVVTEVDVLVDVVITVVGTVDVLTVVVSLGVNDNVVVVTNSTV